MSEPDDVKPSKPVKAAKPDREARLAQALRANLKRRKQAGRAGAPVAGPESGPDEES
ncbi:MAG: hypothetical protein Q8S53_00175 [Brevundimonas sp.]|uniref:hypothetical protein n=1 Tax=Brevundimonas sp. TaxID=1871086 RepID=UPI0027325BF2|nr:hypothetical protein [Brevundimonas sp.]MDP3376756.1 hypothetical protein [Brevundimonas sp.]